MAVYTDITDQELATFLEGYDLGQDVTAFAELCKRIREKWIRERIVEIEG